MNKFKRIVYLAANIAIPAGLGASIVLHDRWQTVAFGVLLLLDLPNRWQEVYVPN